MRIPFIEALRKAAVEALEKAKSLPKDTDSYSSTVTQISETVALRAKAFIEHLGNVDKGDERKSLLGDFEVLVKDITASSHSGKEVVAALQPLQVLICDGLNDAKTSADFLEAALRIYGLNPVRLRSMVGNLGRDADGLLTAACDAALDQGRWEAAFITTTGLGSAVGYPWDLKHMEACAKMGKSFNAAGALSGLRERYRNDPVKLGEVEDLANELKLAGPRAGGKAQLLTIPEVAEGLGLSERQVYRLVKSKKLPGLKLGRDWKFDPHAVEQFIRSGGRLSETWFDAEPKYPWEEREEAKKKLSE